MFLGCIELHGASGGASAAAPAAPAASSSSAGWKSIGLFEELKKKLASDPVAAQDAVKKADADFQFVVSKGSEKRVVVLRMKKGKTPDVQFLDAPTKDVTVTMKMKDADLFALQTGKLDGVQAYMSGKLKVTGNLMASQKLSAVFASQASKL